MAEEELIKVRKDKLNRLKGAGIHPYPDHFPVTHTAEEIGRTLSKKKPRSLDAIKKKLRQDVSLAGRIMTLRPHGKLTFATIQDRSGQIQFAFTEDVIGKDQYKLLNLLDLGDFIGGKGEMFITQKGELTLLCASFQLLSKAMRPLPEKWHGITDQEKCYRQRYLDLIMNKDTRERFMLRSRVIDFLRQYLKDNDFVEVDTPVLQSKASGALAKPFVTHHESLDIDVCLRIAPETYLKRCVVGGLERVFEFARCFRNEGMDPSHLQDFVMLEFYYGYINAEQLMEFTESMFAALFKDVLGSTKVKRGDIELDFTPPLPRKTMAHVVKEHSGIDYTKHKDSKSLLAAINKKRIKLDEDSPEQLSYGNLIDALYKATARKKLIQPFFLTGHPIELSPLARKNDKDAMLVDRFQLVADTWELVNAYSELIDPLDQKERFMEQAQARICGDETALEMDDDYLLAMEHGMPPMAGWGMGVERMMSFITNQENLRDVVLFPLMKPHQFKTEDSGGADKKKMNGKRGKEKNRKSENDREDERSGNGVKGKMGGQDGRSKRGKRSEMGKKKNSGDADTSQTAGSIPMTGSVQAAGSIPMTGSVQTAGSIPMTGSVQTAGFANNDGKQINVGISYADALKLLDANIKDSAVRAHARESEVVMRAVAKRLGADEEAWGILGLLHDIDWEHSSDGKGTHCSLCVGILRDAGVGNDAIRVIQSHGFGVPELELADERRSRIVEHALAASETITGLIYASALMQPEKKIATVKVKSVKKKFKDKGFAAKVNREIIRECEKIGLSLDEFIELALNAMQKIADEIGV